MYWEQTPTGVRCTKPGHVDEHGNPIEFPRGRPCPMCQREPRTTTQRVFISYRAQQLWCEAGKSRERAAMWEERAEVVFSKNEYGHAPKIGTLALQYDRRADELEAKAFDIEHDEELLRHDRDMAGLRGSH